jgi:hypothetical protein
LALAIAEFGLSVTNCSDGALIRGATPKVTDGVEITGKPIVREQLMADLKKSMLAFEPGELLASLDLSAIREQNRAMFRELAEIVDRSDPETPDFVGMHAAFEEFVATASRRYAQIYRISEGTITGLARIAMYCGSRIANEGERRRLNKIYLDHLREASEEMERETETLMDQVRAYAERFPVNAGNAASQLALTS